MKTEKEIISLLLDVAEKDERVRAVLLTGSRANPVAVKDNLQDFDIIYIVTSINSFTKDHSWINAYGERLIMQLPDEMTIGEKDQHAFHYLMLFADNNRIDLTLISSDKIDNLLATESLLKALLDKDNLLADLPAPSEKAYLIKPPDEKAFADCCNEFWWVSTYIAKALWRNEIVYAKAVMEGTVRNMFLQIIEWCIGCKTNFAVSAGKCGRNIQQYISTQLHTQIIATYPDGKIENIWTALFLLTNLFDQLAKETADALNMHYNTADATNAVLYLKAIQQSCNIKN